MGIFPEAKKTWTIHPGIKHLCEPEGARIEQPSGGRAILHAVNSTPESLNDGLGVATLEEEQIHPEPIQQMLNAVQAQQYTKLDSILLARNGNLVLEAYFNGFSREIKHDTRSAFKIIVFYCILNQTRSLLL